MFDAMNSGNGGMNFEESKSHFTAWALMKSPLVMVSFTLLGPITRTKTLIQPN
jgi:hypothetical protein